MATESIMIEVEHLENNTQVLGCPANHTEFENTFLFWVDGVALCSLSILGVLLNLIAIFTILRYRGLHTTFNYLLIMLCSFDNCYIFTTMANQGFMKQFNMETKTHILLYPYLLHPMKHISFTCSIFMTVVVSYERYASIQKPIQHDMSKKNTNFIRRVCMYTFIVFSTSVIFNIPKFMEAEIDWEVLSRYVLLN